MPRLRPLTAVPLALALALLVGGFLPGALQAQEASPEADYRATVMQGIRYHFGALRLLTGGGVDLPSHVVHHASSLETLSGLAHDIFPEGSGGDATRALPVIWTDAEGFQEKLEAFQSAAAALHQAAEAGNTDAVASGVRDVGSTCSACHDDYRADSGQQ